MSARTGLGQERLEPLETLAEQPPGRYPSRP